jgi:putative nucleotidyltransferase with HDIG domain
MRIYWTYRGHAQHCEFPADDSGTVSVIVGRPRVDAQVSLALDLSPDFTVSRPHACFWIEAEGRYWLEDLNSMHGTLVNGDEIRGQGRLRVQAGDEIRIGETLLRIDAPLSNSDSNVHIGQVVDADVPVPALIGTPPADSTLARRLALIYELPLQFAAETNLSNLLQTIVNRLVEVIPDAARGALVLRDRNEPRQENTSGEGLVPQAYFPREGPPVVSKTLARRAMTERAGFIWKRGEEDPEAEPLSGSIIRYSIETGMYAPLLWQGRALGAVCVDNPRRGSSFAPDDLRLMLMVAQYAAMAVANQQLQEDLREAWTGTLDALTSALASRDYDTQSHCYRTVELSVALARQLGVSEGEITTIARGALLHDIGKIGISDEILLKPGVLTKREREIMKEHVRLGHDMLQHIPFFHDALPIVLYHHENYDGTGYPEGLCAEDVPRGARIFHVVDLYDALTQDRPYKRAWTHEHAIKELLLLAGTHCDPEVVQALASLSPEVTERIRNLEAFSPEVREMLGRSMS